VTKVFDRLIGTVPTIGTDRWKLENLRFALIRVKPDRSQMYLPKRRDTGRGEEVRETETYYVPFQQNRGQDRFRVTILALKKLARQRGVERQGGLQEDRTGRNLIEETPNG